MRPHIALFSQTGSEIVNIAKTSNKWPDVIVTNDRPTYKRQIHVEIKDKVTIVENRPTTETYNSIFSRFENPVITLHGWLRIIPEEICKQYEIYNNHPGDIEHFPELKGKDPQKRAYDLGLSTSGNTLHRVTPDVDSGKVIASTMVNIEGLSLSEVFHTLHYDATQLWLKTLPNLLIE